MPELQTAATLFGSTALLVLALGLQSLNVNNGHIKAAVLNSFLIGAGNLILYKLAPTATPLEMAAFLCGGPVGIYIAMRLHPNTKRTTRPHKEPTP